MKSKDNETINQLTVSILKYSMYIVYAVFKYIFLKI